MTATMEPNGDMTAAFETARQAALVETTAHRGRIGHLEAMERNGLVYSRWVALVGAAVFVGLALVCALVIILLVADAASAATAAEASPGGGDFTGVAVLIVGAGFAWLCLQSARGGEGKANGAFGLLALGVLALVVIGVGWEAVECVSGQHFGDPGDGSNPFDQFCPFDKD